MATPKNHKIDVLILTATHNRGKLLTKLVDALSADAKNVGLQVAHIVINDGSTKDVSAYRKLEAKHLVESPYAVIMRWNETNLGARGFWRTVNRGMEIAKGYDFTSAYMIPDDLVPCRDFFSRTMEAFCDAQGRDSVICALNLLPVLLRNYGSPRYLDDCFVADRRLFEALNWKIHEPVGQWGDDFNTGSGTGFQMTKRVGFNNLKIAPNSDVSFFQAADVKSEMFPRRAHPREWTRDNFVDKTALRHTCMGTTLPFHDCQHGKVDGHCKLDGSYCSSKTECSRYEGG